MRSENVSMTAFLVTLLVLLIMPMASVSAEPLADVRSLDAQLGRGRIDRSDFFRDQNAVARRIQTLIPNASENCLPVRDSLSLQERWAKSRAQLRLEAAIRQIRKSETAAWLIDVAAARNVTLCIDHATTLEAHYRSHIRLLGLSARLNSAGRVVFLAHELAHVPQHPHFSNNRRFSPGDMLLLHRTREAAAEAVATRILWQLRQQGITAPWQEKLKTAYHDIARSFEKTMAGGEGTARELWATRSAFHHWFQAEWRLEIYDDLMLNTLNRIANDRLGLVPTTRFLSDRFLLGIANYAGQVFLIGGDGQALIQEFRNQDLPAGGQDRLKEIVSRAHNKPGQSPAIPIAGGPLSAIEPKAAHIGRE